MSDAGTPAGWYPDPNSHHELRYWDGSQWTDDVADQGVAGTEPVAPVPTETAEPETAEPETAPSAVLVAERPAEAEAPRSSAGPLLGVLAAGAAVAVFFGAYGHVHDPTGETTLVLFFTSTINLKVWFTTVALALGVVQILTALRIYGKIHVPRKRPKWLGDVHRLAGTLAFAFTLPVAFHCLWALGYEGRLDDTRRFLHSVAGCAFYGLFVVKVLSVRLKGLPGWLLPVAGSALFGVLAVLWATSSLWFFQNVSFPGV